ncbi:YheC/YheD family protein [Cohnella zeiphila]|uniref:YheC/YheD family protein n=1 Tax=Cohnella zeiphila TaxID=2761120 RepID=A0A7X0SPE4_9BACL|nr:YheC/YheD family protein [Cohnella zeiphila]MBB6733651.1 YheC/YheD family protein [Cohnella zeiphila]
MANGSKHIGSKWKKTKAILQDGRVRPYVPATRIMSAKSLYDMLRKYSMVYVKPVSGTYGNGVARVERTNRSYKYQLGMQVRTFPGFDEMYGSLNKRKAKRQYLVQRGIHLLKHNGRPFDIRVMVQRNSKREWETTGIIARIAGRGKIVTNYHNGGTPTDLDRLLSSKLGRAGTSRFTGLLARIGKQSASALARTYPAVDSVGADIGVDKQYRPWILELNTSPDPYIFRHLRDRRVARKVLRFARGLGRIKAKGKKRR